MYFDYLEEKESIEYVTIPDKGFMTFIHMGDYLYIRDLYVKKDARRDGTGTRLADLVRERYPDIKEWVTEVDTSANKPTESLLAIVSYGFKVAATRDTHIILTREF